ncbi:MAG: Stf0 family sulfotransferase [Bacteroidota bacterium]
MTPRLSYRLWFVQRSGSTLLYRALESTGIAGKPGELFNIPDDQTLCGHHQVNDYASLRDKLWQLGSTPNGVFGIKHDLHQWHYQRWFREIARLQSLAEEAPLDQHESIWQDLFPNCKHLYITRRNKVRLAVSWWKAIQDQTWHLEAGQSREQTDDFYKDRYDFDALLHLFREAVLKEAAMQEYFQANDIVPLTIVYEDFVCQYEKTICDIIRFLDIRESFSIGPMYYQRTANEQSEQWVQRFRRDLQSKMGGKQVW